MNCGTHVTQQLIYLSFYETVYAHPAALVSLKYTDFGTSMYRNRYIA